MKEALTTSIDLCIRGDSLDVNNITRRMRLEPTRAFAKGDRYDGKVKQGERIVEIVRTRPTGTWHLSTSMFVNSGDVNIHAEWLIERCSASESELINIIKSGDLYVIISIWVVGMTFGLPSPLFNRLSDISNEITVSCFDDTAI